MINQYLFELLQVAVGHRTELTACPTDEEWVTLYDMCKQQALVGIAYKACEKLPLEQRPQELLFLKWLGLANRVRQANRLLIEECAEITKSFENEGIHCLVLKGLSNRANYGEELCDYRTSGDIDLWTWADEGGIARIVEFTNQHCIAHGLPVMPWHRILYYHVESRTARGTEVELHYRPSYLNCLWRNRRLQKWFVDERSGVKDLPIPSNSFNAVYQLLHIYKHLFEEGIGLRQILDYYFVLCQGSKVEGQGFTEEEKEAIMKSLISFGMRKLAGAMMYVLQTVFSMPSAYLLCDPDVAEGRFLLNEIMMAGNFGKHDKRITRDGGKMRHAWEKLKHNFRLVGHYPEEVLWEPVFRSYHWIWRRFALWRYE